MAIETELFSDPIPALFLVRRFWKELSERAL
jgi:hypothetical protein